jgi:RNA polymerase sigma factor (sigma-70 family)
MDQDPLSSEPVDVLHHMIWTESEAELRAVESQLRSPGSDTGSSTIALLRELPDETLALALQKGFLVHDSFTELFVHRYGPYLTRWLFRWGTESDQARDIIQQLYLKFYESRLASFRPAENNFRAYLRQSAYNLQVQLVWRAKKLQALEPHDAASPGPGPEQALLDQEAAERINRALEQLRPLERSVLEATMDGRSAAEIALDLDLRKEQVFMTLFRARRHVEQLLDLPPRKRAPRAATASSTESAADLPAERSDQPSEYPGLSPKEPSGVRTPV